MPSAAALPPDAPVSRRKATAALALAASSVVSRACARADVLPPAYDAYASRYDMLDGRTAPLPRALGLDGLRAAVVTRAAGATLEVGCGTGANLPLYLRAPRVRSVAAVELSPEMLRVAAVVRAEVLAGGPPFGIELVQGDAAALPFCDAVFDTVVDTFSLCVFPHPLQALREMRRVLKREREARVLLVEHSLSSAPLLAAWQNITADTVARTSKGCFWNQDVTALARKAGLVVRSSSVDLFGTVTSLELVRDDALV